MSHDGLASYVNHRAHTASVKALKATIGIIRNRGARIALDPRYGSASHCHQRTGGKQMTNIRGRGITSPNGGTSGFPGSSTRDESPQRYTSALHTINCREVGSGLHRMQQPETSWHTCQRGGQDEEPPHEVNYSATHHKPESVRRSANRQAAWVERCHTWQQGQVPGITRGGPYSFSIQPYHTPSTMGR
jgi:hypothetical protein